MFEKRRSGINRHIGDAVQHEGISIRILSLSLKHLVIDFSLHFPGPSSLAAKIISFLGLAPPYSTSDSHPFARCELPISLILLLATMTWMSVKSYGRFAFGEVMPWSLWAI